MFIKSLELKGLYRKDYYVPLEKNLNILYGLNGSGKTTIIDILYLILNGEIEKTYRYNYSYLKVNFVKGEYQQELEVIEDKETKNYVIKINGKVAEEENFYYKDDIRNINNKLLYSIRITEDGNEEYIYKKDIGKKEFYKEFNSIKDISLENTYKNFVKNMKNELVYVPLDRKVKGIESKLTSSSRIGINTNKKNIENSLNIAENYYKEYLRYIAQKEIHIHEDMRIKILTELSKPQKNLINRSFKNNKKDFDNLIEELNDAMFKELRENIMELYKEYKLQHKNIMKKTKNDPENINVPEFFDYAYISAQLRSLYNVIEKVRPLKRAIDELKEKSTTVIDAINKLLKETEKKIVYDGNEGEFYFTNLEKEEHIDLNYLSSGEKQLIMFYIFSIIKFDKNDTKILFIDEPELSLHIDWQSKLLPSIVSKGEETQIIIATHSPDIIGEFIGNTVEIKGVLL
ncbi:putative ATP-binding protein involved in virulence [Planomicrobium soli]|uniref:Putative ATP-binding protein involved in virulence n=1 Tax=Planomicrobium soli TaxID=1176648 RepID=A0A2P8H7F1_9BACL|nr:AAA family ATPase [Planomicrobium soli]PSL42146.1 putative ATP-binding protein involved in virulence [Planomicrobium soli]